MKLVISHQGLTPLTEIPLAGKRYFYLPRNELVEILKVHDSGFLFTQVSLEPVKGEVAVGGMAELAALVTVKLKPGDSINDIHYFVIKKP